MVVISSGTSMRKYGYLEKVLAQLRLNNVETVVYDKILPNPIKGHVMEAAAWCREEKCVPKDLHTFGTHFHAKRFQLPHAKFIS